MNKETGTVTVFTADNPPVPAAGQILIALVYAATGVPAAAPQATSEKIGSAG